MYNGDGYGYNNDYNNDEPEKQILTDAETGNQYRPKAEVRGNLLELAKSTLKPGLRKTVKNYKEEAKKEEAKKGEGEETNGVLLPGRRKGAEPSYIKPVGRGYKLIPSKTAEGQRLREKYLIPLATDGLTEWKRRQSLYIRNLSYRDRNIIKSFTHRGDRLVNAYCRGVLTRDLLESQWDETIKEIANTRSKDSLEPTVPLTFSVYDQFNRLKKHRDFNLSSVETRDTVLEDIHMMRALLLDNYDFFTNPTHVEPLLEQYKQDLERIINGAPRLTKPIVVYRGFHSEHISKLRYSNPDFVSTSLEPSVALTFTELYEDEANYESNFPMTVHSSVYELTVSVKVPCLYLDSITHYSKEFEVLLPPKLDIRLDDTVFVKQPFQTNHPSLDVVVVHGTVSVPSMTKSKRRTMKKPVRFLLDDEDGVGVGVGYTSKSKSKSKNPTKKQTRKKKLFQMRKYV